MNKVLGFERINERRQRPNKLINFIKPLEHASSVGDKELAQDFLERIAAICYPIMKANHVVVMSLEEYPPNKEFWGRNFNAGEIIQLVLRAPGSGNWLPFRHVQMVMMHELAHCKQMNHSRDFWKVNNAFRDELKLLWDKQYSGEGLWGRGQTLLSGRYSTDHMPEAADAPANLCGGTYRSRRGKKRRKAADPERPQLSYAERKQRRIAKKFGVNGQTLGADDLVRWHLDQGRHRPSKPRVAGSKRGRELRAAAAIARFDKKPEVGPASSATSVEDDDEYETDSEDETQGDLVGSWDDNDDVVKVCENEDIGDDNAQRELQELMEIDHLPNPGASSSSSTSTSAQKSNKRPILLTDESEDDHKPTKKQVVNSLSKKASPALSLTPTSDLDKQKSPGISIKTEPSPTNNEGKMATNIPMQEPNISPITKSNPAKSTDTSTATPTPIVNTTSIIPTSNSTSTTTPISTTPTKSSTTNNTTTSCPICSLENAPGAAICTICSHVLDPSQILDSWRCGSQICRESGSLYRNLGDYGRCYICQTERSKGEL